MLQQDQALADLILINEDWLHHFYTRDPDDYTHMSRSVYCSHHPQEDTPPIPTTISLLPIIKEPPTSIAVQKQCLDICLKAVEVLNPGKTI